MLGEWSVGAAFFHLGELETGHAHLLRGLDLYDPSFHSARVWLDAHISTRTTLLRPFYFVLYAGALLRAGRLDAAEHALEESRVVAEATSQHAYDAERCRLLAAVRRARGDVDGAATHFQESLSIARSQKARWFELRAARGYASLLIERQRPDEARQALQVCDWFTEGRETLDFLYADALRKTLSEA
jgi:tetratricopeptide (TPR) repeat protein